MTDIECVVKALKEAELEALKRIDNYKKHEINRIKRTFNPTDFLLDVWRSKRNIEDED